MHSRALKAAVAFLVAASLLPVPVSRADGAAYVSRNNVRFRSGPSTDYSIISTVSSGTEVSVISVTGDWTRCRINGTSGYIYSQYLDTYISYDPAGSTEGVTAGGSSGSSEPAEVNYVPSEETTPQVTVDSEAEAVIVQSTPAPAAQPTPEPAAQPTPEPTAEPTPEPTAEPTPEPTAEPTAAPAEVNSAAVTGYITGNNVRFRTGPSLTASIIKEFYFANTVTITGYDGDWTAVEADGQSGYVYSAYVKEGTFADSSAAGQTEAGDASSGDAASVTGQDIVDFAMQYLGYNYLWGGTDPSTGFDCSGLVYYVYKHFGITLNRVAQDQATNGVHVDPSDLQPGDILCFYSGSSYIGHAGIYIGGGKFIHAASSSTGVIVTDLAGYYTNRGYEARRIIQ